MEGESTKAFYHSSTHSHACLKKYYFLFFHPLSMFVRTCMKSLGDCKTHSHTIRTRTMQEARDSNSVVTGYKVMETKSLWESIVADSTITNLTTPANFCNGEDHSFVVMAFDNCGAHGPPSSPVIGTCSKWLFKTPLRLLIVY